MIFNVCLVNMKNVNLVSIVVIILLLAISITSVVGSNNSNSIKKESPLYSIRTKQAIKEKIDNSQRSFVGEKIFFLQFKWLKNSIMRKGILTGCNTCGSGFFTCDKTCAPPWHFCTFTKCYPPTHEIICDQYFKKGLSKEINN
jgi:hypothetical protein